MFKRLGMAAALLLALLGGVASPALANQTPAFRIDAGQTGLVASHAVGSTWNETQADGTTVSVKKIDAVAEQVTVVKTTGKVSLLAATGVQPNTQSSCTGAYICFWDTPGYLGTFWRYSQAAIVAAGGCYNMTVASNNHSESFYNNSGYSGALHNWVNCNSPSGRLVSGGTTARGVYMNVSPLIFDASCSSSATFNGSIPCDWATSIATDPILP